MAVERIRPSRELCRLAWWGWLTTTDDDLAERLAEFHEFRPPWLDVRLWFGLGLLPGLLGGGLVVAIAWWLGGFGPRPFILGGLVLLYVAGALAKRDRYHERAEDFVYRVVAVGLHLPYVLLAGLALLVCSQAILTRSGAERLSTSLELLVCGAVLWPALTACTPTALADHDAVWPPVGALPSLTCRVMTLALTFVALLVTPLAPWFTVVGVLALLGGFATLHLQDTLAQSVADRWATGPSLRHRKWGARHRPPAYALEAELLVHEHVKELRQLAADYAEYRDYQPEELDRALGALAASGSRRRVLAGALCAVELWLNPDSSVDAAYRGSIRLEVIVRRHGEVLDQRFWERFDELLHASPRAAEGLAFLLAEHEALGWTVSRTWQHVQAGGWTAVLLAAPPPLAAKLLEAVLSLHRSWCSPEAVNELLADLDWYAEQGGATEAVARVEMELTAACLESVDSDAVLPNNHACYPLALRRLALEVTKEPVSAAAVAAWYDAAHGFEALPPARQAALLTALSYRRLWDRALTVTDDAEEQLRQTERYHAFQRRGTSHGLEQTPQARV